MIKLFYVNSDVFVFNVDDWYELRNKHRIVGEIVGNTLFVPSLPLKLLPEEVLLLINRKIATVYELNKPSTYDNNAFIQKLLENQRREYKNIRRKQLLLMLDKIVLKRQSDNKSPDDILEDELEKSCLIEQENLLWPIFLQHDITDLVEVSIDIISNRVPKINALVYGDLWQKGYFITHGDKFGGDFLVYAGDPVTYHAMFIVHCIKNQQPLTPHEIVAFGRLGTSVRKKAILSSIDENNVVSYVTINWIDA